MNSDKLTPNGLLIYFKPNTYVHLITIQDASGKGYRILLLTGVTLLCVWRYYGQHKYSLRKAVIMLSTAVGEH